MSFGDIGSERHPLCRHRACERGSPLLPGLGGGGLGVPASRGERITVRHGRHRNLPGVPASRALEDHPTVSQNRV